MFFYFNFRDRNCIKIEEIILYSIYHFIIFLTINPNKIDIEL